jgi:hypothetical protein
MIPFRLIGIGVGIIGVALIGWRINSWREAAQDRDRAVLALKQSEARHKQYVSRVEAVLREEAEFAQKASFDLAKLREQNAALAGQVAATPRKQYVYVKVPGECPRGSTTVRVQYNAAVTGTPAASDAPR